MTMGSYKKTEEHKKKLSESLMGHTVSKETREKLSKKFKGVPRDPKVMAKIHEKSRGKKRTPEQRKVISESKMGDKNPMFGKPLSESHARKISESNKGRVLSEEGRKNISKGKLGKKQSEEHRKHNRECRIGKKAKEETRQKMSESHIERLNEIWYGGIRYHEDELGLIMLIHMSQQYVDWRKSVLKRDNYRDWFSGIVGHGNLHAHHIKGLAVLIEENNIKTLGEALKCETLWDTNNGVTMIDVNHYAYHSMWG
jgi:hypothetical protein